MGGGEGFPRIDNERASAYLSGTALRRVEGSQSREGSRGGQEGCCETRTRQNSLACVKGGQEECKKKKKEKESV